MVAYSQLSRLLSERRMTVPELHRKMKEQGIAANLKSLYRLSSRRQAIERLDLRVAAGLCQIFGISLSELVTFESDESRLRQLPAEAQERMDTLMEKNRSGEISPAERSELFKLVSAAEEIMLDNARILANARSKVAADSAV